jgi:hypothetical protein
MKLPKGWNMKTATEIAKLTYPKFAKWILFGDKRLYRLSNDEFLVVSSVKVTRHRQTDVYRSDADGKLLSPYPIKQIYSTVDHAEALNALGWTLQ